MEYEKIKLMDGNEESERFEHYQSKEYPLTESMKSNILLAEQCFDDEVAIAVLGEDVMMAFNPGGPTDYKEIEKEVNEKCTEILSGAPDFETMTVDDKAFMVFMGGCLFSITPDKTGAKKRSLGEAIMLRQNILDACEGMHKKVKIYGVAFGQKY